MTEYSLTDADGTVRWRGTIDPAPGGGSQAGTLREYVLPITFATAGLKDGVTVCTLAEGDRIFPGSAASILTEWDGDNTTIQVGVDTDKNAVVPDFVISGPDLTDRPAGVWTAFENGASIATDFYDHYAPGPMTIKVYVDDGAGGLSGATQGTAEARVVVLSKGTAA